MLQVSLDALNGATEADFVAALGDIFEHAPWVASGAAARRPFATLDALYQAMTQAVRDAAADRQFELIAGHPDLAGKAGRAGELTAASRAEQSSAGLDGLTDRQYDAFRRLNAAYRAKFAMPFIACVRRHTRESVLAQFEQRLNNAPAQERDAALKEIFRIAALRLDERVSAPDRLKVHGRLSTHVLDTRAGRPGQGIPVELAEIGADERRIVARAVTNADGRTDRPLIEGRPLPIGRYELSFQVAAYFAAQQARLAEPAFLDTIPIRFAIAEPEGHYHVPLLVTPWSYTTYRGS
jgi:2-oxo-4-hydroxy-4-carboxy-5-ureidoimidazoline decarboxylase